MSLSIIQIVQKFDYSAEDVLTEEIQRLAKEERHKILTAFLAYETSLFGVSLFCFILIFRLY